MIVNTNRLSILGIFLFSVIYVLTAEATENTAPSPVIKKKSQRIISLGGDITEIIYALDAEKQLVGVDTSSLWPESVKSLPQVGYFRALSAEGLISLSPDMLIMSDAAGPESVLEQVESTGISSVKIKTSKTAKGVIDKINQVAIALSKPDAGITLNKKIISEFKQLKQSKKQWQQPPPRVVFLFSVSKGSLMVSGSNTAANAMIEMAGGINVVTEYSGYKPINNEALIAASPDFILLTGNTLKMMGGLEKIINLPGLTLTPAARQKNIIVMDTLYLLGFGPRTGKAALELSQQLHPETREKTQ